MTLVPNAHLRPGTTDENVLREVFAGAYRRSRLGFDVMPGERWLDLGGNIGAFAMYCASREATCVSYEPDPTCFNLLAMNLPKGCNAVRSAVTARHEKSIPMFRSSDPNNFSRMTAHGPKSYIPADDMPNVHIGSIKGPFDGIKMDIEGSEGEILDSGLLPKCNKLVLEYHSSRDKSVANFVRRMEWLRTRFENVSYLPELDRIIESGRERFEREIIQDGKTRIVNYPHCDRMVFCWGAK